MNRQELYFALLVVLLGAALRFHRLDEDSLWMDEIGQVLVAQNDLVGTLAGAKNHIAAAPFDYLVLHISLRLLPDKDFTVRLPAAIWGTLTVALVYAVGRVLLDRTVGLLAALLAAISPFLLRYAQEARFYSLYTATVLVNLLLLFTALRRNTWSTWLAFVLASAVSLYAHYYGFLVLTAEGLYVIYLWSEKRVNWPRVQVSSIILERFILAGLTAVVLFAPWLMYDRPWEVVRYSVIQRPAWVDLAVLAKEFLGPNVTRAGLASEWPFGTWVIPACTVLTVIGVAGGWWLLHHRRDQAVAITILLVCLGTVPYLLDRWSGYIVAPRQFIGLVPFVLIVFAVGLRWLAKAVQHRLGRIPSTTFVVVTLAILALGVPNYYSWQKSNFRELGQYLQKHTASGDVIVGYPQIFERYYVGPARILRPDPSQSLLSRLRLTAGDDAWLYIHGWDSWLDPFPQDRTWIQESCAPIPEFAQLLHCEIAAQ